MKTRTPPVALSVPQPADRLVKRSALVAFKAIRAIAGRASEVPGVLSQAGRDVRLAWQESARPNA